MNLAAVDQLHRRFPDLDLILIESGGDNLAATFSPELADITIYVIDVSAGDKIPRKGGPGITRSDLLLINKIDLAPYVDFELERFLYYVDQVHPGVHTLQVSARTGDGVDALRDWLARLPDRVGAAA